MCLCGYVAVCVGGVLCILCVCVCVCVRVCVVCLYAYILRVLVCKHCIV